MQTIKKEFDLEKMKGFPITDLVYDKQENAIFKYTVYNDDFSTRKQVSFDTKPVSQEIAKSQSLEAIDLVEANEKGGLNGELKEIAAKLDVNSNPVIMLIKHRKQSKNYLPYSTQDRDRKQQGQSEELQIPKK